MSNINLTLNNNFRFLKLNENILKDYTLNENLLFNMNIHINKKNNAKYTNNDFVKMDDREIIYIPNAIQFLENNPHRLENYNNINLYTILDTYLDLYDYITSKKFYNILINLKKDNNKINELYWIWISINPYAIDILENNLDKIDWDLLSLNPICIDFYKKIKLRFDDEYLEDNFYILNEDFLSVNPSILTYNYKFIKYIKNNINISIIEELFNPKRISKYLEINDNIDNYLN